MLSDLIKLIRKIYGGGFIPLHKPKFNHYDFGAVETCIDERVDCYGKEVAEFEQSLSEYTGAKHVIATCSGTAALMASLAVMRTPLNASIPNYTFKATENALDFALLFPTYEDIEPEHLCITHEVEETTVVPVWMFGMPTNIPQCKIVVEDAAQALGTFMGGKHVGTFGKAGILSFNGNKILTTGGGGAVLTGDAELANSIRNFIRYDFNLRMPALNAALGLSQMDRIEDTISRKRELAHTYHDFFAGSEIRCIKEPEGCRSNYWLNTLVMPSQMLRDYWFDELKLAGIEARKGFKLLDPNADTPVAKKMAGLILNLPSGVPG